MQHFNLKLQQQQQQQFFPSSHVRYQTACVFDTQPFAFLTLHLCKDQTLLCCVLQRGSAVGFHLNGRTSLCLHGDFPVAGGTAFLGRHVGYTRMGESRGVSEFPSTPGSLRNWEHLQTPAYCTGQQRPVSLLSHDALSTCCMDILPGIRSTASHSRWNAGNFLELVHRHPETPQIKINA